MCDISSRTVRFIKRCARCLVTGVPLMIALGLCVNGFSDEEARTALNRLLAKNLRLSSESGSASPNFQCEVRLQLLRENLVAYEERAIFERSEAVSGLLLITDEGYPKAHLRNGSLVVVGRDGLDS